MTLVTIILLICVVDFIYCYLYHKQKTKMEETFNTNKGKMTEGQLINSLTYITYEYNRDLGLSHESLKKMGIGTEDFKDKYELEKAIRLN